MIIVAQLLKDIFYSPLANAFGTLALLIIGYFLGRSTQKKAQAHESGMATEAREQERQQRIRDGYADVSAKGAAILSINTEIRLGAWQDPDRLQSLRNKAQLALGDLRSAVSVIKVLDSDGDRCAHANTMFDHANSYVVLISRVTNPHDNFIEGGIHADAVDGIQNQIDAIGTLFA